MRPGQKGRLRRLRLSKKCKHFFEWRVALRSAPRLAADGGQLDAHSARSIFCHAHVAAENDFTFFTACGRRTLRGFFDKLRRLLAGVLAGAMVLPLSACGGKGGPYVDIPPAYRSWDEDGKAQDFSRLGTAEGGMVAAMRYEAAKVGTDILDRGGNVVDAAVATALALTVTMPEMCGLAGGGYMTYYCGETGETVFLNFRETTPAGHTPDLWPEDGQGGVEGRRNQFGGLSVGVPGEVDGLYYALETYGTMDWADVVRPAIGLAREGFTMTPALQGYCQEIYSLLLEKPELGEIYLTEQGLVKPVGEVICNAPMAKALELLRDNREMLDTIASYLFKKETITGMQMMAILEGRDPDQEEYYGVKAAGDPSIEPPAKHVHMISETPAMPTAAAELPEAGEAPADSSDPKE